MRRGNGGEQPHRPGQPAYGHRDHGREDEPGRDDEWCNPERQALGQPPTTATTAPGLGALLWIKPPGESDGLCRGEHTYFFSPAQARRLIADSPWVPPSYRRLAAQLPA